MEISIQLKLHKLGNSIGHNYLNPKLEKKDFINLTWNWQKICPCFPVPGVNWNWSWGEMGHQGSPDTCSANLLSLSFHQHCIIYIISCPCKNAKAAYLKKCEMSAKLDCRVHIPHSLFQQLFKNLSRLMIFFQEPSKIIFDSDNMLAYNEFHQMLFSLSTKQKKVY